MAELKRLKAARAQVKGQLTRINNFLATEGINYEQAQTRFEKLQELWLTFNDTQTQIEVLKAETEEDLENVAQQEQGEREVFETIYYRAVDKARSIIVATQTAVPAEDLVARQEALARAGLQGNAEVKLPTLKLPIFSGEYEEWMLFKDAFQSLIHDNRKLSNVQKFQYLRSTLKDEALQVINNLNTSAENYLIAWDLLREHYENKKLIINTHLHKLLEFPVVTKDKHVSLKQFIMHLRTHLKALQVLGQPVDQWDAIIIFLARSKLDYESQRAWEEEIGQQELDHMPTIEEFLKFLGERCRTLEMLHSSINQRETTAKNPINKRFDRRVALATTSQICVMCKGSHCLFHCSEFLKLSIQDRIAAVKQRQLCINCLKSGHYAKECKASKCRKCSKDHNTLLHIESEKSQMGKLQEGITKKSEETEAIVMHCVQHQDRNSFKHAKAAAKEKRSNKESNSHVILATAQIYVRDGQGRRQTCRVVLDSGSQLHFITEDLVERLQLPCKSESSAFNGIMRSSTHSERSTKVQIESKNTSFKADLECLVVSVITEQLPQVRLNKKLISIQEDYKLADPNYDKPGPVDILIGAALFWNLLEEGQVKKAKGYPIWQRTQLGWIIGGELVGNKVNSVKPATFVVTNQTLNKNLERFWTQEEVYESRQLSAQEDYCEDYFKNTVSRDNTGRFVVRLPKREEVVLGDSKQQAIRRFYALEKRFRREPLLKEEYVQFMEDYEQKGHMSLATPDLLSQETLYFIPHQPIIKPDSLTTKLRVVFDASAKSDNDKSLNDVLLPGPNLQSDLLRVLLRFRLYKYVITGDIAMMFRQIVIAQEDRNMQLIMWRKTEEEQIAIFSLNTVTYGTACAPYLAMRCLKQLAEEDGAQYPMAQKTILSDFYMDDVLTGSDSLEETINLQKQLTDLLAKGHFHLRKWRANDNRILSHMLEEGKTEELLVINKDTALKTLGILWHQQEDTLQYQDRKSKFGRVTKRTVISEIAQIYDPMGLIAPVMIVAKILMQQLWRLNLNWDDELPSELYCKWKTYQSSWKELSQLKIPRRVIHSDSVEKITIHGFSDASERAYGACLYAVTRDSNGSIRSHLLCAKSRVSPLKVITVAKLELCAALLLAKLYQTVKEAIGNRIKNVHMWSDSTIVLGWIGTCPSTLKTFVANRISQIQALGLQDAWHHVPSAENPADIISKGTSVEALKNSQLWWYGPWWLQEEDSWPEQPSDIKALPERKTVTSLVVTQDQGILPRVSSFGRLLRIIAYCFRFGDKCRLKTGTKVLTVAELERAENAVVRVAQGEVFSQEIHCLQTGRPIKRNSKLVALDPFLDARGLICVGGRLRHADMSQEIKHPIILPSRHFVTELILRNEHVNSHHCGSEQLLALVRQRYWIISGRREARKITRSCLNCFRLQPKCARIKMGDLPATRVNGYVRPFTVCGVDYAGPIQIRESRRRGRVHISKAYVALFICFSSKAVHIELVTDLTTESYLAALRRFTGRRGNCLQLYSDNATNFIGAARELKDIYEFLEREQSKIQANLANQRIEWHFIPPRAPNFGGLWESNIKSLKKHFYAVTKGLVLTFEECYTLLVGIEAVLNSRPLTPLSSDVKDLSVLTPSHFLLGERLYQPVERNYLKIPDNRLKLWQHLQKVRQDLWRRWQKEYLIELQRRVKWTSGEENLQPGTMVLLMEDNLSPLQWAIGRITHVHPGDDNIVRVVTVRTVNGTFKRSARKVCPLPTDDSDL